MLWCSGIRRESHREVLLGLKTISEIRLDQLKGVRLTTGGKSPYISIFEFGLFLGFRFKLWCHKPRAEEVQMGRVGGIYMWRCSEFLKF